jgi:hypothetical protein
LKRLISCKFFTSLCLLFLLSGSLSGCFPQAGLKEMWQKMKTSERMEALSFQFKAMRRDLKTLFNPIVRPFLYYPPAPDDLLRYNTADAPLLEAHLVDALALKSALEKDLRLPLLNRPRIYANNPRRGQASVFYGQASMLETDPFWQEPPVHAWVQTHRFNPAFRQLWKHHPALKAPMTHQAWWAWVQASLTLRGHDAPLSVQKQMPHNPSAELQWRLAKDFPYFPSHLVHVNQSKMLSRGEGVGFALWLSGLAKERLKTAEDDYTEWWASPMADSDARASLMEDWARLTPTQQHTLNMAYATGLLDATLNDKPPHSLKALKYWPIRWNGPLSTQEAIRLIAWAEAKRLEPF